MCTFVQYFYVRVALVAQAAYDELRRSRYVLYCPSYDISKWRQCLEYPGSEIFNSITFVVVLAQLLIIIFVTGCCKSLVVILVLLLAAAAGGVAVMVAV